MHKKPNNCEVAFVSVQYCFAFVANTFVRLMPHLLWITASLLLHWTCEARHKILARVMSCQRLTYIDNFWVHIYWMDGDTISIMLSLSLFPWRGRSMFNISAICIYIIGTKTGLSSQFYAEVSTFMRNQKNSIVRSVSTYSGVCIHST